MAPVQTPKTTDLPITNGHRLAFNDLVAVLYGELRRLAHRQLGIRQPNQPLQTTSLVHEAYLRLSRSNGGIQDSRTHCLAAAAVAMRRILIEEARSSNRQKRGGEWTRVSLEHAEGKTDSRSVDLVALSEALERLATHDHRKCMVVQLRFFAGLTNEEISEALKLTTRTVERDWQYARAWLFRELSTELRDQSGR